MTHKLVAAAFVGCLTISAIPASAQFTCRPNYRGTELDCESNNRGWGGSSGSGNGGWATISPNWADGIGDAIDAMRARNQAATTPTCTAPNGALYPARVQQGRWVC